MPKEHLKECSSEKFSWCFSLCPPIESSIFIDNKMDAKEAKTLNTLPSVFCFLFRVFFLPYDVKVRIFLSLIS